MLAEKVDYVIGVDTHRDQHTLAVVVAPSGAVVAQQGVGTTIRGLRCGSRVRRALRHWRSGLGD